MRNWKLILAHIMNKIINMNHLPPLNFFNNTLSDEEVIKNQINNFLENELNDVTTFNIDKQKYRESIYFGISFTTNDIDIEELHTKLLAIIRLRGLGIPARQRPVMYTEIAREIPNNIGIRLELMWVMAKVRSKITELKMYPKFLTSIFLL